MNAPIDLLSDTRQVTVTVNGKQQSLEVEGRTTLADMLRQECRTPGVRVGCEHGVCGSCTILFDGEPMRACLMLAVQADGHEIKTIESMADGDKLHAIQEAFSEEHGLQCGFCTAGIILSVSELLERCPRPSDEQIYEVLGGHLCRCTGYQQILQSVRLAADMLVDK